ncbi:MAG: hypothetical protein ACK51T_08265, partial [bacterium]
SIQMHFTTEAQRNTTMLGGSAQAQNMTPCSLCLLASVLKDFFSEHGTTQINSDNICIFIL